MSEKLFEVPAIVLVNPKYRYNIGGTIRSCSCFGVNSLLWTGARVNVDQYERLPREERMKGYRVVTWTNTDRPFDLLPKDVIPVCVEIQESSENLTTFVHPENAVYLFGPEDGGVPQVYRRFCHRFVHIPSHFCLNLSAAVNVVLYDRRAKRQQAGLEPILPISEMLHEHRGVATPTMDNVGWDGR